MITIENYFGPWINHEDATADVKLNAQILLEKVNQVMDLAFADGVDFRVNPSTLSHVSGKTLGGFRPQDAAIGSPKSAHKTGQAVDIYDPDNELDIWCFKHHAKLKELGLCMEHPDATPKWCHLSTRFPPSGKTVFMP